MECIILHRLRWRLSAHATPGGTRLTRVNGTSSTSKRVRRDRCGVRWYVALSSGELAYQTELSVREYWFTTQCSTAVAVAALMNASEQLNEEHFQCLTKALMHVLNEFEGLDEPYEFLKAREQLLKKSHEPNEDQSNDDDDDSINSTTDILATVSLDESLHAVEELQEDYADEPKKSRVNIPIVS